MYCQCISIVSAIIFVLFRNNTTTKAPYRKLYESSYINFEFRCDFTHALYVFVVWAVTS